MTALNKMRLRRAGVPSTRKNTGPTALVSAAKIAGTGSCGMYGLPQPASPVSKSEVTLAGSGPNNPGRSEQRRTQQAIGKRRPELQNRGINVFKAVKPDMDSGHASGSAAAEWVSKISISKSGNSRSSKAETRS